ncbi:hypothetical protein [uncultured phage cr52_1]|uniref:Uncharacterized protein n=1 Tax=uncultured phage cr52_1 TaxID=2772079 RepID=A0A7M1RQC9_9CAUD|nr:hypothetical protein KNV46_gp15 [uncultured phage cr52_1]QOR56635.1 hypothetical protein [uncultured phage cr52_1]
MKTILYNPIFINPLAYYVFPRLTRWLRPDDSYKEPANYIGLIEVTIIAYGEIGYTEYFEHTNYIDFTNFSNSYVRISLFTRLGSCVLGEWKIGAIEGDRPYIEPEVLASLKAVVIVGDKTNQDKDRDIVANLVDASNPFIISNAAFKLNSGYGKYEVDFTTWSKRNVVTSNNDNSFSFESKVSSSLLYYSTTIGVDTPSFKIKANISNCLVYYYYINDKGTLSSISILESGEFELPISHNTLYNGNIGIGFEIGRINGTGTGTITQIPSYQGAFVTDGVDDLITSTKTVQEMLGESNECTVLSMMCQIGDTIESFNRNNWLLTPTSYLESRVEKEKTGKTGIYGYTSTDINNGQISNINSILGDKNDYTANSKIESTGLDYFSVEGFQNEGIWYTSSVAWYWTIIANKVLTTDQINQVIAYYNLDRCVEPTVLYDVKRQGLSNDTPDSDWYLKDFSKNGFDMSLFNFAKKGGSGVAAKQGESTKDWSKIKDEGRQELTIYNEFKYKVKSNEKNNYWSLQYINYSSTSYPITIIADKDCFWSNSINLYDEEGNKQSQKKEIAISANTPTQVLCCGFDEFPDVPEGYHPTTAVTYAFLKEAGELTIEIIPSCKGALCSDGVNDFGKVTGLPIYKDYTVVADREIETINGGVLSKSYVADNGSFIFEQVHLEQDSTSSFGYTKLPIDNLNRDRKISYQSKYSYNGTSLSVGTGIDGSNMWLATIRDNDSRFSNIAIYSLMSFPYSMSEFLIERQLKKHKLGTLYPDMVEWRPIIKSNSEYTITAFSGSTPMVIGLYYPINTPITFHVKPKGLVDEVVKLTINGKETVFNKVSNTTYIYDYSSLPKSPQKIDITIDEYIRYEDIDFTDCYPGVPRIYVDDKSVTWGNKLKVGDKFTFYGNVNILPEMYNVLVKAKYNGEEMTYGSIGTITKSMAFTSFRTYTFNSNEPKCILSPSRLRIPNSSYKILGYIPDISGHGNHGVIHNSVYAKGSGVNEDGSYQFDGVNDFVTIPTLFSGGKQVLMKVNWDKTIADAILYDQRGYPNEFAIYNADVDNNNNPVFAYQARNNGQTYIDGILNKNIKASELRAITHNITITNELSTGTNTFSPVIGSNSVHDAYFTNMALYDFMLFDSISTDDKIKELNEYVGIEGNTE